MKKTGIGSHESHSMQSDVWLTPPHIIERLGPFTLDPCAAINQPWPTASHHYTKEDDGLSKQWFGRVWCNPPYGAHAAQLLERCASHGDAIALIFARTETAAFFEHVWQKADGILFIKGRLTFHYPDGTKPHTNSGAPSCLVAYGKYNADKLKTAAASSILGAYVDL